MKQGREAVRALSSFQAFFGIDARSLAFFRIGLGFLILTDLFFRSLDLTAFYTDQGVLPRSFLVQKLFKPGYFSLHVLGGSTFFEAILFSIAGLFALCLLLGYRTRICTFFSWVLLLSIQNRNPEILNAGSNLFRMLLFWSIFLPLGRMGSLDASRDSNDSQKTPMTIFSAASVALLLQVAIMYGFAFHHRKGPDWHAEGSALFNALSLDQMVKPFGHFWLKFPIGLELATRLSLYFEIAAPILFFLIPFILKKSGHLGFARTGIIFALMCFHLAIYFSLETGLFQPICIVALISFLPGWFWERVPFRFASSRLEFPAREKGLSCLNQIFVGGCLLWVLFWNISNDIPVLQQSIPKPLRVITGILRLDQKWKMFSDTFLEDGWFVIPGKLVDGRVVDLWRQGRPVSWDKPQDLYKMYPNEFWQKYMTNLARAHRDPLYRNYFAKFLCRQWNKSHDAASDKLLSFEIYYIIEQNLPNYQVAAPRKANLWAYQCK